MKRLLLFPIITFLFQGLIGQTIFINEIHYDNTGGDVDEGVEIAGPAGTDLTGYSIELYNGGTSTLYGTTPLSGIITNQQSGYGTINFLIPSIQNGSPDAIALIDNLGTVLQFLSYEGTLTAADGTASGQTSTDIGISQGGTGPIGESLQLVGTGTVYSDFTWVLQTQTRDAVNTNQYFGTPVPTVSFDAASIIVNENAGTITVNVIITNEDANPTSVDVVLGTSTATLTSDFVYTSPTTVTFPGSSNATQTITLDIVDDIAIEPSEDIVLELQNVTNSGIVGLNGTYTITITDNDTPPSPEISFDAAGITVDESAGTMTINLTIINENTAATSVEVFVGTSSAVNTSDFTFVDPTTVTFPPSSNAIQSITLDIIDDASIELTESIVLEMQNFTNGSISGANAVYTISILDNDTPIIPACSEIFFSEYIEGSAFNKAIEIYNPTNTIVDLSTYEVRMYGNGSLTPTSTLVPSGMLLPGKVHVITHGSADQGILDEADQTSGVSNFNGDDALELYNTTTSSTADVIGEIGVDPGTQWVVGSGATKDFTLVRKSNIDAGVLTWTGVGDTQWDVYAIDDSSYLGSHTNLGCTINLGAAPLLSDTSVCLQNAIAFTDNSYGGTAPYTIGWDFGDGNVGSGVSVSHVYSTPGDYTVTLSVIDGSLTSDDSVFVVHVNPLPTVSVQWDSIICIGGTATLEAIGASGTAPYSYLWDEGSTTNIINPMPTGDSTNTVIATDANGCASPIAGSATITMYSAISASALSDQTICAGDNANLSASATGGDGSFTYTWDNSVGVNQTPTVSPITTTTYTVSVTDGCETPAATASVTITVNTANPDFSFAGEPTVGFTDISSSTVATYLWDFGDGNTSTIANPSNTYTSDGSYTVCLTITSTDGCTDSICKTVAINSTSVKENISQQVSIYPNPVSNGTVTIKNSSNEVMTIEIANVIGQQVWKGTTANGKTIDVSNFNKGNYFVKIVSANGNITKKLVIQ